MRVFSGYQTYGYAFKNAGRTPHKYDKLVEFLAQNRNSSFTRAELLIKSGYTSKDKLDAILHKSYMSTLTGSMRQDNLLKYDAKTKRWSVGDGFDAFISKYYENVAARYAKTAAQYAKLCAKLCIDISKKF